VVKGQSSRGKEKKGRRTTRSNVLGKGGGRLRHGKKKGELENYSRRHAKVLKPSYKGKGERRNNVPGFGQIGIKGTEREISI